MSAVYDSDLTDIYEVSVMLALANHADDSGHCYPSIARIARLARMKERGVQNVVRRLSDQGYLQVKTGGGRGGTNVYIVVANPAPHAPETSLTIIEPSIEKKTRAKPSRNTSIPEDAVISEKQIQIAADKGHGIVEAEAQFARFKNQNLANGKTFKNWNAAWTNWLTSPYFKTLTGGRHEPQSANQKAAHRSGAGSQAGERIDPALEQISRLARTGPSSGNGGL